MAPIFKNKQYRLLIITCTVALIGTLCTVARPEPLFEQKDIFIGGIDGVFEYRIPALAVTKNGTLLAVCDARMEKRGDAPNNIDLVLKRSFNNGKMWQPLETIIDFPGREAACDPTLLVDQKTGKIIIFFDYCQPAAGLPYGRTLMLYMVTSDDDGKTWSKPVDITPMVKDPEWIAVQASPGVGINTSDGKLIMPCYSFRSNRYSHSQLACSTDQGKTWKLTPDAGANTDECQVIELSDGSFLFSIRRQDQWATGYRAVTTTCDGGQTWSQLVDDTSIPDPTCQASLIRYTDKSDGYEKDRVLFSNPASKKERIKMTVRLSYDEGKTWPVSKLIYPGPSSYSCLTILPDDTIGLLYENGLNRPDEKITFARFNLEWLTENKDKLTKTCTKK